MDRLVNLGLYSNFSPCDPEIFKGLNYNSKVLDSVVQLSVLEILSVLPVSPDEGDKYILETDSSLNIYIDGDWLTLPPHAGFIAYVENQNEFYSFDGSIWSPMQVDLPKENNHGLNFFKNPSFEDDTDDLTKWTLNPAGGILQIVDTFIESEENKKMFSANLSANTTLSTPLEIPIGLINNNFVFRGWVGPLAGDLDIGVYYGLTENKVTLQASAEWQPFNIFFTPTEENLSIEFRNSMGETFYYDEFYLGPVTKVNANDVAYDNSQNIKDVVDLKLNIAEAYLDQEVDSFEIDFLAATQYMDIVSDPTFTMTNVSNGKTTILTVTNTDSSDHTVTLPAGVVHRSDINLNVESGKANVYTFFASNNNVYVACVDGLA